MAALPRALQHLKGRSSHKLLSELCCASATGVSICGRGDNWVVSAGNVTDDMWLEYIRNQVPPEPDDNFNVTVSCRRVRRYA
jgi:putative transposase